MKTVSWSVVLSILILVLICGAIWHGFHRFFGASSAIVYAQPCSTGTLQLTQVRYPGTIDAPTVYQNNLEFKREDRVVKLDMVMVRPFPSFFEPEQFKWFKPLTDEHRLHVANLWTNTKNNPLSNEDFDAAVTCLTENISSINSELAAIQEVSIGSITRMPDTYQSSSEQVYVRRFSCANADEITVDESGNVNSGILGYIDAYGRLQERIRSDYAKDLLARAPHCTDGTGNSIYSAYDTWRTKHEQSLLIKK